MDTHNKRTHIAEEHTSMSEKRKKEMKTEQKRNKTYMAFLRHAAKEEGKKKEKEKKNKSVFSSSSLSRKKKGKKTYMALRRHAAKEEEEKRRKKREKNVHGSSEARSEGRGERKQACPKCPESSRDTPRGALQGCHA